MATCFERVFAIDEHTFAFPEPGWASKGAISSKFQSHGCSQGHRPTSSLVNNMLQEGISIGGLAAQRCLDVPWRKHCSFTLVLWDEDLEGRTTFNEFQEFLADLISEGYVTLHLSSGMPYWLSSQAKNTGHLCASLLTMHYQPAWSLDFSPTWMQTM